MLKNRLLFLFAGIFLLPACVGRVVPVPDLSIPSLEPGVPTASLNGNDSAPADPLLQEEIIAIRNSEYQLGSSDQFRTVQLVDGRFKQGNREDPEYISVFVTNYVVLGDLNDDGRDEAVALITENYGGTGSFVFLSAYHTEQGTRQFLASIFLDDLPMIHALSVEQGLILVEATVHNRDDPMCCPTLFTSRTYQLNDQNLVLREFHTRTPGGQPRLITIESPVEGTNVSGRIQVTGRVSIAPFENTLVYRLFDMGGVELSAGPVLVEAPDLGAPGTFNADLDLGNILTNTTIRIEIQDVNAADGSLFAMDSVVVQTP